LHEIAHFVRSIDLITESKHKIDDDVWITPNALTEMRQGREQDKALLMASMMTGAVEENTEEATQAFLKKIKEECKYTKSDRKV
jgi:hypothetical protein